MIAAGVPASEIGCEDAPDSEDANVEVGFKLVWGELWSALSSSTADPGRTAF